MKNFLFMLLICVTVGVLIGFFSSEKEIEVKEKVIYEIRIENPKFFQPKDERSAEVKNFRLC